MYVCEPINGWMNDGNGGGIRGAESCDTTTDQCFQRQCSKVAKLAHLLMGVIRAEVADCDVVDH